VRLGVPARKHAAAPRSGARTAKAAGSAAKKKTASTTRSASEQLAEYRSKRDFSRTAEPSGNERRPPKSTRRRRPGTLRFVIQKHAASHLHFDLRLEIDGVMKSWAVPKGPSADPAVKRLAMQVEDHPIAYNSFEGTIPAGEYGGGTVMLWDTGTYTPEASTGDRDDNATAHAGYERGDLKVVFHGQRMRGSWVLVRTKRPAGGSDSERPSWLLIKHRDDHAISAADGDLVRDHVTSVTTGRDMARIAAGTRGRG